MKKNCITFFASIIIILSALVCTALFTGAIDGSGSGFGSGSSGKAGGLNGVTAEYLRIHIRADSNEDAAQSVKYEIRDEVVDFLIPVLAVTRDKESAKAAIRENFGGIEAAANKVLAARGFSYRAKAELKVESFPSRVYDGVTLPAGDYEALILNLGSGEGNNWWCVAYPPLCFSTAGGKNVAYRSLILERIAEWKARRKA